MDRGPILSGYFLRQGGTQRRRRTAQIMCYVRCGAGLHRARRMAFVTIEEIGEPAGDPVRRKGLLSLGPVFAGLAIGGPVGSVVVGRAPHEVSVESARPSTTMASPTAALPSSRPVGQWPTAQSPITAYLAATGAADSKAALDVWIGWPVATFSNSRRVLRTDELAGLHVGPGYRVTQIVYQTSSNVVEREMDATFASVLVEVTSDEGVEYQLLFMVARETRERRARFGVAGGQWTLYDVIHLYECTEMGC